MAFNFTDELGFIEGQADPSDFMTLFPVSGSNAALLGKVKFTSEGVYGETDTGSPYSQSIVFWPWCNIAHIQQNR